MTLRKFVFLLIVTVGMLTLLAFLVRDLIPLARAFIGSDTYITEYLESFGGRGIPMLVGLQTLQIIIPIMPAASIAALTGLFYGTWQGVIINMTGRIIGNFLMFMAWRKMKPFMARVWKKSDEEQGYITRKFTNAKHPTLTAAFIVFVPGIPYSVYPYMFAKTNLTLTQYMAAIIFGGVPWVFLYSYMGNSVAGGNYTTTLILLCVLLFAIITAIIIRRKLNKNTEDNNGIFRQT